MTSSKKDDAKPAEAKPAAVKDEAKDGPDFEPVTQVREDVGAAALPDGPDEVKVITEVNPGTAN